MLATELAILKIAVLRSVLHTLYTFICTYITSRDTLFRMGHELYSCVFSMLLQPAPILSFLLFEAQQELTTKDTSPNPHILVSSCGLYNLKVAPPYQKKVGILNCTDKKQVLCKHSLAIFKGIIYCHFRVIYMKMTKKQPEAHEVNLEREISSVKIHAQLYDTEPNLNSIYPHCHYCYITAYNPIDASTFGFVHKLLESFFKH